MSSSRLAALSTFLFFWAAGAVAQERGFRVHRYDAPTPGSQTFLLDRPWYSGTRHFAGGVTADYARRVLVPRAQTGREEIQPVLDQALLGSVDLASSLFDRVLVRASLPLVFLERGLSEPVSQFAPLSSVNVGDPRVGATVRLFGQAEEDALSAHLGLDVWIPVGLSQVHQGDSGLRFLPHLTFAGAFGAGRWGLDLAFLWRQYASLGPPALGMTAAPEARASASLGLSLFDDALYFGPEAQFATQVVGANAFAVNGMSLEVMIGLNWSIARSLSLGLAAGTGFFGASGTPDLRGVVRLAWAQRYDTPVREVPRRTDDADFDAVADADDRCPFEPETVNGIRDDDGCPEFAMESGGALAHVLAPKLNPPPTQEEISAQLEAVRAAVAADAGMTVAELDRARVNAFRPLPPGADAGAAVSNAALRPVLPDAGASRGPTVFIDAGAPPGETPALVDGGTTAPRTDDTALRVAAFVTADSDGDGIADEADRCPVTPEDADGFEDEDGCPETDNDEDGFEDLADSCPLEAETLNGIDDTDGCPDTAPDADADTVADAVDRCPFEPESLDGVRDEDGCPELVTPVTPALSKILALAPVAASLEAASEPKLVNADSDGDGVVDDEDRCPVSPEDKDGFEDEDGCPEPDNDGDAIADAKDQCNDAAETLNGWQDEDGCPDEHPDVDGDGVDFAADRCPLEKGDANDGCPHVPLPKLAIAGFPGAPVAQTVEGAVAPEAAAPAPVTADFDKDSATDDADRCPMTSEDKDGFEDEDGCPEPDNDRDGVADKQDRCPYEAEVINGVKDDDGCPDLGVSAVRVLENEIVIDGVVRFKPASAALQPVSFPLLKQVALKLRAAPSLSVEIQGHTDDVGSATVNIALSKKRAETIRDFLVKAGVPKNRLLAKGFGPTKPRASNRTPEGREQNRRVEFLILGESK